MLSDIFAATGRVTASVATMHYIRNLLALPCVAVVLLWVNKPSLVVVLGAYLAASILQFSVALVPARHDIAFWRFTGGVSTLRTAIGQGTQLFALEFSTFMLMQGTIWLATAAFSPVAATQYGIAVTLAFQVTVLEGMSSLAITPPAARLWAAGRKEQVVRMLSNAATLSTVVVIIVVGLLAVLGGFVIDIAYGSSMRPAATMLLILAVSGIAQACFAVNMTMLIVSGHIAATSRSALLVLSVALPCAVAAAWLSGPTALAVVTSFSVSAMSICQWLTARKIFGYAPRAHYHVVRAARELLERADASPDVETVP
jgi:O-antigen/teichoic acid export membrane protein